MIAARNSTALVCLLLLTCTAPAMVRRVPSEYATIQAALDSVQNGDTVLVALGTYAEALTAPARSFALIGEVVPDTGDYPRPIIDPSPLPGSPELSCLNLGASVPVIEDIRFRNGAAMYPHSYAQVGGVYGGGEVVVFRRCVFDSTAGGYRSAGRRTCVMDHCRFLDVQGESVYNSTGSPLTLIATDCFFHSRGALFTVRASDSSRIQRCHFGGNPDYGICCLSGRHILIEDCMFGPSAPDEAAWDPALLLDRTSGLARNNVFTGLRLGFASIRLDCACNDSDVTEIRNNHIFGNTVEEFQGSAGVTVVCSQDTQACRAVIADNVCEDNHGNVAVYRGAYLRCDAQLLNNHFAHLTAGPQFGTVPTVRAHHPDSTRIRGNWFDSTDFAMLNDISSFPLEARHNWWGDASGPFHRLLNPFGHGDTVGDEVDFTSWCIDTINCQEPDAAPDAHFLLPPSSLSVSCFPNPFNNATMIRLQVPKVEIVRVELFDLLGRRVQELWSGVVADEKEIAVDGSGLASGVYFARATNTIWNRPLVTAKLVLLK